MVIVLVLFEDDVDVEVVQDLVDQVLVGFGVVDDEELGFCGVLWVVFVVVVGYGGCFGVEVNMGCLNGYCSFGMKGWCSVDCGGQCCGVLFVEVLCVFFICWWSCWWV